MLTRGKDKDLPAEPVTEAAETGGGKGRTWRDLWRPVALLTFVIAMIILARIFGWGEHLGELRQWIQSLGAWGPLVFVLLYILATVAALPGVVLSVIGGAIFGSVSGVILVSIASTLGASLAFLIARYFAREAVARWLSGNEKFKRLDEMTERHGAIIVAIVRLIPLFAQLWLRSHPRALPDLCLLVLALYAAGHRSLYCRGGCRYKSHHNGRHSLAIDHRRDRHGGPPGPACPLRLQDPEKKGGRFGG